jgi:hypothetical protein
VAHRCGISKRVEQDVRISSGGVFFFTGEAARRAGAVKSNWQWAVDVG